MPVKFVKLYTRELVQQNPEWRFVFGDNFEKKGLGGQARACRWEPNAIGWPTKKAPNNLPASYLTEEDYGLWLPFFTDAYAETFFALKDGRVVVFPEDGIGTGLARLPEKAPKIYNTINESIANLVERFGLVK